MLQIQHIHKEYKTGSLVQKALDDVSLNLRDHEFVAILGPSGSGKTTLLNVIGGLDRYDSGDLIINGISTKKYKEKDWDSYRNHTIGFVFQSYNLIPHQTVLANVELALTISGISKEERRTRAIDALEKVGLGKQLHKRPSQMSGGQMQRVAIARALVNNPDILLADEPTGALDSDTSIQVMDLLKEVAKDRLVVMVTHNPELAEQYATRIVTLRDGKICSDSDPLEPSEKSKEAPICRNFGKSSMSFLTALSLSFNNLRTKKARTILTSFAGSIGIIGIALILAFSTGVNSYIQRTEEETLSEYPLQIQSTGISMTAMMAERDPANKEEQQKPDAKEAHVFQMVNSLFSTMNSNDLSSLKSFLDSEDSGIMDAAKAVEYSYPITPLIYKENGDSIRQVNPDLSFSALGLGSASSANSLMASMMSTDVFYELPENDSLYKNQYEVKAGHWPEKENECVLVLSQSGSVSDFVLYAMGLRDPLKLDEMVQQFVNEDPIVTPSESGSCSFDDILSVSFRLVNRADCYEYDDQYQIWKDKTDNTEYMKQLVKNGEKLSIVGIVQPVPDTTAAPLGTGIAYPASLTRHVIEQAAKSRIVKEQLANPSLNVFTGETFGMEKDNSLDTRSMITVDEEALKKAFQFDESALEKGMDQSLLSSFSMEDALSDGAASMDLSDLVDIGSLHLDLTSVPVPDLSRLFSDITVSISKEGAEKMVSSLMEGYAAYAKEHPEADYSGLQQDFLGYLSTPEAKAIFTSHLQQILAENGGIQITTEQIRSLITSVMAGFQQYALEKGYTDASQFDAYLAEYLQTPEALSLMAGWLNEVAESNADFTISPEQIQALSSDLAAGYQEYTVSHQLPDPSRMSDYFLDYLNSEDGKQRVTEGISDFVDLDRLQNQVSSALGSYMANAMGSYTKALSTALSEQISSAMNQMVSSITAAISKKLQDSMKQIGNSLQASMGNAMTIDTNAFADAFRMNLTEDDMKELFASLSATKQASFDGNLQTLGYADFADPSGISIYPKDFESKDQIVAILDDYNTRMKAAGQEEKVISYTDMVGTMMSSVTDIIDIISYVLIAFVAISLVVSSIMIGVITYISVLERKKEIGILRAMGASRRNISEVFNAETFIIGLCSGIFGIGLSLLLLIPCNAIIHHLAGNAKVSAFLPPLPAILLILLSIVLTLLGGLIPSRKAAKSDPVTALRTE